jgi:hypothetical protein
MAATFSRNAETVTIQSSAVRTATFWSVSWSAPARFRGSIRTVPDRYFSDFAAKAG